MWSIRNLKDHDVSYATAILRQVIKTIVSKGLFIHKYYVHVDFTSSTCCGNKNRTLVTWLRKIFGRALTPILGTFGCARRHSGLLRMTSF